MPMRVGFALRSTVFSPSAIAEIIPTLEQSNVDSVWFPSVGQAFDALDMCGISLGATRRLRAGTGVVRCSDYYDVRQLHARIHTLSEASGGRFVLGLGTGSDIGRVAIDKLIRVAAHLRADEKDGHPTPIFFAALKKRALRAAYANAEGAILNFCPPDYVEKIVPKDLESKAFTLCCYIKLFFAEKESVAREMLVDELKMYNGIPQYHSMFTRIGVASSIERLDPASEAIPENILEISFANPDDDRVRKTIQQFSRAGVDLPIIYPYVAGSDQFRVSVVKRLAATV